MKKLLFFILAITLGTYVAFSQNLSLVYEGNPIPANHTIGVWGPANGDEMVVEIDVTNNSSSSINVKVKKIENYIVTGSVNTFCWGLCFPPFIYESPDSIPIPAGGTNDIDFSGHYNPNSNPGQSSISYVFFDNDNPNDSVMVTVLFYTSITGITPNITIEFTISDPYPNPASSFIKFDYDLNRSSNAQLKVYSLVGSLVREINITDPSGMIQVNTDELEDGFYFYILYSSGKELKTGKFIVSH